MHDEVLTTEQTAKLLSISVETVRHWTQDGIIPACQIRGPVRRYIKCDVIAALRARQSIATTVPLAHAGVAQ